MTNVDIKPKTVADEAREEVEKERREKARKELVKLYRALAEAEDVVANIKRELEDVEQAAEQLVVRDRLQIACLSHGGSVGGPHATGGPFA